MKYERVLEIINQEKINEVYYNERQVWIQELNNNIARIGFIDNNDEKSVNINKLYEKNLLWMQNYVLY